ncbi:FG-GAP repeat domain-containing protein [Terrabacter sp. 2RAF25]|uniref:FG-GAP repeat domain-containing protein n=1 Tax=Terrabacter sp. 2RAF25 TaxID=3232998 RepID=UPI003F9E5B6E
MSGAAALAVVICCTAQAGVSAAASADPVGTVVLPAAVSAQSFDNLTALASSAAGTLVDAGGGASPSAFVWVTRDGVSHPLPDLAFGWNGRALVGSELTSIDGTTLHRYDLASGTVLAGDGTTLTDVFLGATSRGWVTVGSRDGVVQITYSVPGQPDLSYPYPSGTDQRVDGESLVWAEGDVNVDTGKVMRLDLLTGETSVTASLPHAPLAVRWTPSRIVWAQQAAPADGMQQFTVCSLERVALDGQPRCNDVGPSFASSTLRATDSAVAWTAGLGTSVSDTAPGTAVREVSSGSLRVVSVDSAAQVAGERFVGVTESGSAVVDFDGSAEPPHLLRAAGAHPAEDLGLSLGPGRLVGSDDSAVTRGDVLTEVYDDTYPAWSRALTTSPTLALGAEQPFTGPIAREYHGSAIGVSGPRVVLRRVLSNGTGMCPFVVVRDGAAPVDLPRYACDFGVNLSGRRYLATTSFYQGISAFDLDGRKLATFEQPIPGTADIYGPYVAYVADSGDVMLRDLRLAVGASNPRRLLASTCGGSSYDRVSVWGRFVVAVAACDGRTTVIDRQTGATRGVPQMHHPQVMDGAVVWREPSGTGLFALDLTTSSSTPVRLGDVRSGVNTWNDSPWFTTDDHLVAWQDAGTGETKVAGLPFQAGSAHPPRLLDQLTPTSLAAAASGAVSPWHAEFDATKVLGSWRLDLRNASGAVVRTWTGSAPHGGVRLDWDGRLGTRWAPGGRYTWTLTGSAADGEGALRDVDGAQVPLTGSLVVKDAKVRDLGPDRVADLLGTDAKGGLWRWDGTGVGTLKPRVQIGSGWGGLAVAGAGDLTGDGRPDLLARDASGGLWRYDGNGAGGFRPRVKVATGWNVYSAIVGAGDLTGDGRVDVLARDTSGRLWRYDGTGTGGLRARVSLGTGWNGFTAIIAPGDLTGDGRSDLLVRDAKGNLARYDGTGSGSYRPRVALGAGWNGYPVLTGIGDVTGDGAPDLLARDAAGTLWRYPGNGRGGFTARAVTGASGWQAFPRLF